jgi:cell division septation protein DedD
LLEPKPEETYYVQVGAYSVRAHADIQFARVKAKGFDAIVKYTGTLYRVQVGAYTVKANADDLAKRLRVAGFEAIITTQGGTFVPAEPANTIKAGSIVRIKKGAKTFTGGNLADFVYTRNHVVKELSGSRAVVTYSGVIVAAVKVSDLILQ